MPRLCVLNGIVIWVNTRDRLPPHFHAKCSGDEVRIKLEDLTVMSGQLSPAKQRLLLAWAAIHKGELVRNWDLARQGLPHHRGGRLMAHDTVNTPRVSMLSLHLDICKEEQEWKSQRG